MAVELAIETFEKEIENKDIYCFIDNTIDCYGFVRGGHKDKAIARLIKRVILSMRKKDA